MIITNDPCFVCLCLQCPRYQHVPREFRQYVRCSIKLLHKTDKPKKVAKLQDKIALSGLAPEVTEFVSQVLLEFHAKLSQKRPCSVVKEMKDEERVLPDGMERRHFLWLCRFLARWHRRHAGKCDVMAAWSSGSSEEEGCATSRGEEGCEFAGMNSTYWICFRSYFFLASLST
jgi:hypothetical protein